MSFHTHTHTQRKEFKIIKCFTSFASFIKREISINDKIILINKRADNFMAEWRITETETDRQRDREIERILYIQPYL